MTELEQRVLNLKNDLNKFILSNDDKVLLSDKTEVYTYSYKLKQQNSKGSLVNENLIYDEGDIFTFNNDLYLKNITSPGLDNSVKIETPKSGNGFKMAFSYDLKTDTLKTTHPFIISVWREAFNLIRVYFTSDINVDTDVFCSFSEHTNVIGTDVFSIGTTAYNGTPGAGGYNVEQRILSNIRYVVEENSIKLKFTTGTSANLNYNPVVNVCVI